MVIIVTLTLKSETFVETTIPNTTDWKAINWHKVIKYVDRMQKRIYHAQSTKNYRKVRNLQRILVNSKAILLLAIYKVTYKNKGKRTPGIDGFRALSDTKRAELFNTMKNMNIKLHNPKPAYRKYIRKKNGKLRSLGIPVIIDRIYQEIIRMALEPQAETNFEATSYGFRPKRGCHDAASRIMTTIVHGNWNWVFEGDFKSCFDTLSHSFIIEQIKSFPFYDVVEKFLKAGYVDNNIFHSTEEGTPQGGIISPLLANIALNGMEKILNITYKKSTRKNGNDNYDSEGDYRMVRYADDFIILAKSRENIEKVYEILKPYLDERGLQLAEDKTKITHLEEGFDFLGFNFRRYKTKNGYKHLYRPSKNSIKEFKLKVAEICKSCQGQSLDILIDRLNPLIRGTANYWDVSSAKRIFLNMDYYLWHKVFSFLKRLHQNKPIKWIKKKYYPPYIDENHIDNWVPKGPKKGNRLIKMGWIPIKRYSRIQHNHSPYDKTKEQYFKNRAFCTKR